LQRDSADMIDGIKLPERTSASIVRRARAFTCVDWTRLYPSAWFEDVRLLNDSIERITDSDESGLLDFRKRIRKTQRGVEITLTD
jgi:hypothetical protein